MPLLNQLLFVLAVLCCTFHSFPLLAADAVPIPKDAAEKNKLGLELFKKQVRADLVHHCVDCHGGKSTKADFDLTTREKLLESGFLGDTAGDSHLMELMNHATEPHMPFKKPKLSAEIIDRIALWIDLGAPYDQPLVDASAKPEKGPMIVTDEDRKFWSFQPLKTVQPPPVKQADWCRTDIDRFILAQLESLKLHPNPPADRLKLIRRAYFDLIGTPPTPEEVTSFINDSDPHAYEKLLDRLLASPHYGERWARHWMDVARFAESHGYEQDYDRPHAYHYRDFLIKALNSDLPYHQFIRWQLAGDELEPENPLALTATGFLGGGAFPTQLTEAEFESARYDELDDMTATTGVAFLGLSVGCARCHDHKYDPFPTKDYYRLAASFTTAIRSEIELELEPGQKPAKVQVTSEGFPHTKHHADDRGFPHFYPVTHVLHRGDVHQKQEEAKASYLQVLMRGGHDASHWQVAPPEGWTRTSFRRASLANWMTDVKDGAGQLAARVAVNRLWQHHFGRGIVATPNDFGFQGERPTHPDLLDWLASDFIAHEWQVKRLHELIVTSAVYMQSSDFDETRARLDRENQQLWRFTPRRLEAEAIRDSMLSVSGLLDEKMYGPGTLDANMKRRSVYFFIKRSKLIPLMMLFDWPEHLVSIGQRSTTTTATQALAFLNSPQGRQYAVGFAKRLPKEEPAAIEMAFRISFGREPKENELTASTKFLEKQRSRYKEAGQKDAEPMALVDLCQALLSMNEFVYVD